MLFLTCIILLISLLIQTVELLQTEKSWSDQGIWKNVTLQSDLKSIFFSQKGFKALLYFRLLLIAVLFYQPNLSGFLCLLISQIIVCVRWRGTYNGGSDMMSFVVLLGVCMSLSEPPGGLFRNVGMMFIAVHAVSSYFFAGLAKLRQAGWRNGSALKHFLQSGIYPETAKAANSIQSPIVFLLLSWVTILFECLFPLSLLNPVTCVCFVVFACVFHTANAFLLGLNRFLFAWAASWPSLIFCAGLLAAGA